MSYKNELQGNNADLLSILNTINSLPNAGESEPVLQEKSVTPTKSAQAVTPDNGYDGLSKVNVAAMPTATQATPSISVNSSGLITASATQSAGYVDAGTKSGTKQLTTQAAKTVTPSTSEQTAVASGVYTTGVVKVGAIPSSYVKPSATKGATTYTPTTSNQTIAAGTYCSGVQTIKGDANLKAENIAEGVSIFGIAGTHSGGGSGGGGSVEACTGKVVAKGPVLGVVLTATYNDINLNAITQSFPEMVASYSFEVAKNTILFIKGTALTATSGCTRLGGGASEYAYLITGNNFVLTSPM